MSNIRAFGKIIEEICNEQNIKINKMSDDWIIELNKNGITKYILGYKFDLNSSCTSEICNDKYALFSILENSAIPVIKHDILFGNNEKKLLTMAEQLDYNFVLKPNNGTCGNNIFHITCKNEVIDTYRKISRLGNICVCPFYNIKNEFRIIYLNGKAEHIYKKVKPTIVGNGKSTIKELLLRFNSEYYKDEKKFINKKYNIDYIPKDGEIIEYEWRFNLSKGATISEAKDEEKKELFKLALLAAEKINLKFGSIDIIKTIDNQYKIIEINSGVMMENLINLENEGYEIAKNIYKKAIELMFA
ncbi:MAG: hypothetical protein J6J36_08550 [Clostridia bacterium]|nr:hypothetical protein [Clostridia bacterium]